MRVADESLTGQSHSIPVKHKKVLLSLVGVLVVLIAVSQIANLLQSEATVEPTSLQANNLTPALSNTNTEQQTTDTRLFIDVRPGNTLSSIFKQAGVGAQTLDEIVQSSSDSSILSNIYPGYQLAFEIDELSESLLSLEIIKNQLESFKFTRTQNGTFNYAHLKQEPEIRQTIKSAVITESLFLAAQEGGIPAAMAQELAGIFGGVIDFLIDTREGDTFRVVYEEHYLHDQWIGYGKILGAEFTNQGQVFTALRYQDSNGKANFYNPNGESMRKAFLLNPVDFTRISSGFSLSRKHPTLNTIRAHKGIDYAAPRGTQVLSTADGRVTAANTNGSFGKLVVIQHGETFTTKYAHLNAFAKGIKAGVRVRQGDIIGYVGSTGGATGPHLHYEFLVNGVHKDSRKIFDQLPKAESLDPAEMPKFHQQTAIYATMMASIRLGDSGLVAARPGPPGDPSPKK